MAEIEVRFYGRLADRFGASTSIPCEAAGLTVAAIRDRLGDRIAGLSKARPLIGDSLARETDLVAAGTAVEFLPPVAGG